MKNQLKRQLGHLDAAHTANQRISAISSVLMAYHEQEELEAENLRVIAHLIHNQTEVMRESLSYFRKTVEINPSSSH